MALDDSDAVSSSTLLRHVMHELAAAYENACAEHGADSRNALMVGEALLFMRGWMRRYSAPTEAGDGAPP